MDRQTIIKKIKTWKKQFLLNHKRVKRFFYDIFEKEKPAFGSYYLDLKHFYVTKFNKIPSIIEINNVNLREVFKIVNEGKYGAIKNIYQYNEYSWDKNQLQYEMTIFEIKGKFLVYLGYDDVFIYYQDSKYLKAKAMLDEFKKFRALAKKQEFEMNIITLNGNSLELKTIEITPLELDINLYYNDDFKATDKIIKERLSKEKDKGIVLLHGLPGTGKTTYLRHLIGALKKKVMFVSPNVARNLMNPEFMDLLIDNPNSVLIIEDAENIIMDRRFSNQSSVSNLLNISDGLLSDCLNVQIICTFNSELSFVDSALLRKGRLIAKYEFGKLTVAKASQLSKHLGLVKNITQPMTLAEITNPQETHYEAKQLNVIGFRREMILEN